jgi:hypothetical protein
MRLLFYKIAETSSFFLIFKQDTHLIVYLLKFE